MSGYGRMNGQAGFSLLELLFVICIIAILCGMAFTRLDVKQTTASAWSAVNESAYRAAKGALIKALAQDPDNPPSLAELANRIDSKFTVYATNCINAATPTNPTPASNGFCLGINIDGDLQTTSPGEIIAAAYSDGDCQTGVTFPTEGVCCLERPFFETSFGASISLPFI